MADIKYEIVKEIAVLSEKASNTGARNRNALHLDLKRVASSAYIPAKVQFLLFFIRFV